MLAATLIALPIAALVAFIGVTASDTPSSEQALRGIPEGADAVITATAISRDAPPFVQLPEGPPGPWMDDAEVLPAGSEDVANVLDPDTELHEYWKSPKLIASVDLGLAPGEQRSAGAEAAGLDAIAFDRLGTVELTEAEPGALSLLVPDLSAGTLPGDANELVVSAALAERLALSPGDTVTLLAPPDAGWRSTDGNTAAAMQDSEHGFRVVGVAAQGAGGAESAAAAGTPAGTPAAGAAAAWALPGWLSGLVDDLPEGIQRHWLATGGDVTWEQTKALNEAQAFAVSRHVLTNYPPASELYPVPLNVGAYIEAVVGIIAMGVVGGLLVLFLVTPAFAVSAEQSRRSLGLAAAAGAAPRDLRRIILSQGIVLGAIGGLAGLALGVGAAVGVTAWFERLAADSGTMAQQYSLASLLTHFPWWVLPVAWPLAVGLGALAALPPARTAARMAPVDALRDRRPAAPSRGRIARLVAALGGPALIALAVGLGLIGFTVPLGEIEMDPELGMRGTAPAGAQTLGLLVAAALICGAAGLALSARAIIGWLGTRGGRARPALRLALRDAADHPSRSVPATLGVMFALAAAAFTLVTGASLVSNMRDSGTTLEWNGTFMVGPAVGVSDDFDRLLATAAVDDIRSDTPEVTGSKPIFEVARASALQLQPFRPAASACEWDEVPHVSSATRPGAELKCVNQMSGAGFNPGFRIGGLIAQSNVFLFSGDAVRATGMPGAEAAAQVLDAGGAVVNDATFISEAGTVRVGVDPDMLADEADTDEFVEVPGAYLRGLGTPFVVSPGTARALGVDATHYLGEIATVSTPLSDSELFGLLDRPAFQSLARVSIPDSTSRLAPANDPVTLAVVWSVPALLGLVAVAAATVAVLLAATQGRRDAATMHAVGAGRGTLARLGVARAAVMLGVGLPLGIAGGIAAGSYQVAWNRHIEASGAWLDTVMMWDTQFTVGLAVLVAALAAALLVARSPRSFVRRGLD
ncbi:hypothetical protein GCM10020360_12240 [Nonlabens tegetincola]